MKKNVLILAIIFILMQAGCSGTNAHKIEDELPADDIHAVANLEFKKAVYSDNDVRISYPQISNQNSHAENTTNQKIKQSALSILDTYTEETKGLSAEIDYTFEIINNKIISICFKGVVYAKNAAYPNNVFYTINIDADTSEILTVENLLEVNMDLTRCIKKNAKYVPQTTEINEELTSEINRELKDYDLSQMLTPKSRVHIYLKQDGIGLCLPVLHVLGDYANFEVEYNQLTQFLNFKI